jgi:hypothetical protein
MSRDGINACGGLGINLKFYGSVSSRGGPTAIAATNPQPSALSNSNATDECEALAFAIFVLRGAATSPYPATGRRNPKS